MANDKRYVSIRMYLPDSSEETKAGDSASVGVQHHKSSMGSGVFHIRARRQQHHDSRLHVRPDRVYRSITNTAQVLGLMAFVLLISHNANNWKAVVLFLALLLILIAKVVALAAPLIMKWLRKYWA